jgi:nitrite reductase/ring-hydroxylating ferredoxin subunit
MNSERRAFLKDTCKLCASIVGISIVLPAIEGCAPLNYYSAGVSNGKINVPVASFVEETNMVIVKDKSLNYQVAIIKQKDNSFRAFELKCTHQDNALIATKSSFVCSLHGSSYDLNGKVTNTPASTNLKEFPIEVVNETIQIQYL